MFRHPLETTAAILLRRTRLTESSLIVTWLTNDHGKLKTVAKGARQPKSKFAGRLDLFFDCEIQIVRSRHGELHALREVVLKQPHEHLRHDYNRVAAAAYFVELIELVTEADHPVPEFYDLLRRALGYLDTQPASRRGIEHFEKEMARLLGVEIPGTPSAVALERSYHRLPAARSSLLARLNDAFSGPQRESDSQPGASEL